MTGISELENTLLDQIEKLNDDSIEQDTEKAQALIAKSQAIGDLAARYIDVQTLKLKVVQIAESTTGDYDKFLGLESK